MGYPSFFVNIFDLAGIKENDRIFSGYIMNMKHIFGLSEKSEWLLQTAAQEKVFNKKAFLLREGQHCKHIWWIQTGLVKTFYNKDGKEINLEFTTENNFVAQLESLRKQTPSKFFIQAVEAATVLEFDRDKLSDLYLRSEEISHFGRSVITRLLAEQEAHANRFKILSPAERYKHLIRHRPELIQRVSLSQLASYLGISRETLSRLRKP